MAYFLRYTNTSTKDLKRGTSVNASDMGGEVSREDAAAAFGCDKKEVKKVNGLWCQVLKGLCGYLLEAETIEEAIEEVEEERQFSFVGRPVIFSGKYADGDVADGDLFTPFRIEVEL